MSAPRYPGCHDCYFKDREPAICEECENEDQYEPADDAMDTRDIRNARAAKLLYRLKEAA